ncbi:unnamed protein product [Wickerhamomyces anomalus]
MSSASSLSNESVTSDAPQPFGGPQRQSEELHKVHTISSLNPPEENFISSIKKTLTHQSQKDNNDYEDFTEKNIYGEDLDSNEIQLKRTQTKATIINTLEERAAQEYQNTQDLDIESMAGTKSNKAKSIYEQANREEALPTLNDGTEFQKIDPELVTWDGDDDPENPKNWSDTKKWVSVAWVALYTLLSPFASTMLSPAISSISADFHNDNSTISALMVSIYILAWAIFPPFIAPLSEMYGRKIVLDVSVWFLLAFNFGCAFSQNTTQMCVFRLLAGIAGYIVERADWRWCFYVLCMFNFAIAVGGNLFLKETYAPTLLSRKAAKLRKLTGNQNLHCIYEVATGETTFGKFYVNLSRPLSVLFKNPMVLGLGIFMAVAYGCLYILIVTFPAVWGEVYGFGKGSTGLMYLSFLIGYIIGIVFFQYSATWVLHRLIAKNNGVSKPEFRLPMLLVSGITLPVGLFWYGWGAEKKLHFMFPAVGAAIFGFGLIAVFYCIQNYLIDMNPRFAASSIAAASIFRSYLGFAFPLFAPIMFKNVGYGWGCSIFGFIALATGIPFPLFVILYGERLRLWGNRIMDRAQAKRDAKNLARLKRMQEKQLVQSEQHKDATSESS